MTRTRRDTGVLAAMAAWACATNPPVTDVPEVAAVTSRSIDGVRIHVVRSGWVRVKQAHRTLSGPESTRMLAIVFDRDHTAWMPVLVGIIDHPDGVFLVDAGLDERILDIAAIAEDRGNAFVYSNLLHFRFDTDDRIDRHLARLGIDPGRLAGV
ncbi:MAG: hypothetical protein IAG13_18155, partial [Deltaproteobacteria bacterium]|nr:hypothetical protein [Nannocystaceae bacterium]